VNVSQLRLRSEKFDDDDDDDDDDNNNNNNNNGTTLFHIFATFGLFSRYQHFTFLVLELPNPALFQPLLLPALLQSLQ
jgi:hypothetical protein